VKKLLFGLFLMSLLGTASVGCGGPDSSSAMPEKPDPMPTAGPSSAPAGKKPSGDPPAGVAKPPSAPPPPPPSL
jgi:hypothetical protein